MDCGAPCFCRLSELAGRWAGAVGCKRKERGFLAVCLAVWLSVWLAGWLAGSAVISIARFGQQVVPVPGDEVACGAVGGFVVARLRVATEFQALLLYTYRNGDDTVAVLLLDPGSYGTAASFGTDCV